MSLASISLATAAPTWRADLQRCALLLLAILLWDSSGFDLTVARWFADASGFGLRSHWVVNTVLHRGGRALGWFVFAALAFSLWRPLPGLRTLSRRDLSIAMLTCLSCVLMVNLIKHFSLTSCPWSLAEFGGTARYVSHWTLGVVDGGDGGCFPSGHATTAFSFFSLVFALRSARPDLARRITLAIVVLGGLFGLAQTLRGAHYPSHTLWTAWLCLALTSAIYAIPAVRPTPSKVSSPGRA